MPEDHPPISQKPHLDDLLAMIGVAREQLTEMTAEDLFGAATRWQHTTAITSAAVKHFRSPSIAWSIARTGHRLGSTKPN